MTAAGFGCRAARMCAAVALLLLADFAHAADHRFQVLLDTDNNPATGCTVATSKGPVAGVDQVWTTVVTTSASNIVVKQIEHQTCVGGVLGASVVYATAGWPVNLGIGVSGTGPIETYVPLSFLPTSGTMKVVVASTNAAGGQDTAGPFLIALGAPGGGGPGTGTPIPISPWVALSAALLIAGLALRLRRMDGRRATLVVFCVAIACTGLVFAGKVILDGNIDDWAGVPQVAGNAKGSAPIDANIVAVFYQSDAMNLYFRIDADLSLDAVNQPPVVSAGPNQTITLPNMATLNGSATDDGLPNPPGALTYSWTQDSGPVSAVITSPTQPSTTVSFSLAGVYVFRLTASDSALSGSATTQVTVNSGTPAELEQPPVLGAQDNIVLPVGATFARTLTATDPDIGDTPVFALVSGPSGMTLVGAALQWSTTGRAVGNYPVVVKVTDRDGRTDSKQFLITLVSPSPPVAYDDDYQVILGQTLTVAAPGVLGNDIDPAGEPLTANKLTDPDKGTLTAFNADGSFTYQAPAVTGPVFQPALKWQATTNIASSWPLVAEVLGDGQPYIIESSQNSDVFAFSGKDGSLLWHVTGLQQGCTIAGWLTGGGFQQAIGDIDDSGQLSLVFPTECAQDNGGPARIMALNAKDGSFKWLSPPLGPYLEDSNGNQVPLGTPNAIADILAAGTEPTIARLNAVQTPSILLGLDLTAGKTFAKQPACNELVPGWPSATGCRGVIVLDGKDGTIRQRMAAPLGGLDFTIYNTGFQAAVAADLDGTGTQEIIYGGAVFNADGSVHSNLTSLTANDATSGYTWWSGLGNFDDTPDIEVVRITGNVGNAPSTLAVYKSDGSVLWQVGLGIFQQIGVPVIADIDASGRPSVVLEIGTYVCAIDFQGSFKWCYDTGTTSGTPNLSSGVPFSVYDLEGTGIPEIIVPIYGGKLLFLNGGTGALKSTFDVAQQIGATATLQPVYYSGGPVVADVDASGHAAIVTAWGCCAPYGSAPIVVINGQGNTWLPARTIWNQATFYDGNIDNAGHFPSNFVNSFATPSTNAFGAQSPVGAPVNPLTITQTSFTYTASDSELTSAPANVAIDLLPQIQPLQFLSTPPTRAVNGMPFSYDAVVRDPNAGGIVTYSLILVQGGCAGGYQIGAASGIFTCAIFSASANFPNPVQSFVIQATDQYGASATQSFTLQGSAGPAAVPNVVGQTQAAAATTLGAAGFAVGNITQSYALVTAGEVAQQHPAAGANALQGTAVDLMVSLGPPHPPGPPPSLVNIARIVVSPAATVYLVGHTLLYSAVAVYDDGTSADITTYATWASTVPTVATVDAIGTARTLAAGTTTLTATAGGMSGTASLRVVALVPGDNVPPTATITQPASGATVTGPTQVVGSATDANFLRYELAVAPSGGTNFTLIGQGTAAVTNGVLGTFDPTLLLNGAYTLQLTVYDAGGNTTTAQVAIVVTGNQKVGLFTIAYNDLTVPVSGLAVQVVRTYDSRDKKMDDFGVGWSLGVNTFRVSESGVLGAGWQVQLQGQTYVLVTPGNQFVSVALPNGRTETFDLLVNPSSSPFVPFTTLQATFVARPGTLGSLQSLDNVNLLITDPQPGPVTLLDDTTLNTFNPDRFLYKAQDGTQYVVTRTHGVESATDTNGNRITISASGITSSAGPGITFTRDAQGRITAIMDPNGHTQTYTYSATGDLATHVNATGDTTSYFYTAQHGLVRIVDPLGRPTTVTQYDDEGRVISITNAAGYTTTYTHNIAGQQEQTQDALGRITITTYDANGNVLSVADPLGHTTTYTYDVQNNRLTSTNPLGATTSFSYDANNYLLSVADPLGHVTQFTRDAAGRPLTVTDPRGNATTMHYDAQGNLIATTDALGHTTASTFDGAGNLTTLTDANGATTTNQYDSAGRRTQLTNAVGGTVAMQYDANGNLLTQADSLGLASGVSYDANNRPLGTSAGGVQRTVAYDAAGELTHVTTAIGRTLPLSYDPAGRLLSIQAPGGTPLAQQTYDPVGNAVTVTDALGNQTNRTYDAANRLIATQQPDGSTLQVVYDAAGDIVQLIDALGNKSNYAYDAAGHLVTITDALGGQTSFQYDVDGNRIARTDPAGHITQFAYDALDRLTQMTYADGTSESIVYDAVGNVVQRTDTAGNKTSYAYDTLGNLLSVTNALSQITQHAYVGGGQRTSTTDANGHNTQFAYDKSGRLTQTTYPFGQTQSTTYDAIGDVLTTTNGNGETIQYQYDAQGRVSGAILPDGTAESYTYTVDNLLSSFTDPHGTTTVAYDPQTRRLVEVTEPDGRYVRYAYDANGNRTLVAHGTSASELATYYSYDALGRVIQITDPNGGVTTQAYDAAGNVTSIGRPNRVTTQMTYDARNRVLGITDRDASNNVLESEAYTIDALGNRTRIDRHDGSHVDYQYDALGRVIDEQRVDSANNVTSEFVYAYDPAGNMVTNGSASAPVTYAYNADNELVSGGSVTYTYDAAGRRVQQTQTPPGKPPMTVHYTWDAKDRLTSYQDATGATTTYTYDIYGVRQAKGGAAGTVNFLVDRDNATAFSQILRATTPSDDRSFVYGSQLLQTVDPGLTQYRQFDHSNSTVSLTGATGAVTDTFEYQAYGNLLTHSGTSTAPHRFAGEESDPESGLTYLRARYYDPTTGGFLSRDPAPGDLSDPLSLHPYLYASDNPVNRTDPSGHETLPELSLAEAQDYQMNAQAAVNERRAIADANADLIQVARGLGGLLAIEAVIESIGNGGNRARYWFGGGTIGAGLLAEAGNLVGLGAGLGNAIAYVADAAMGIVAVDMIGNNKVQFAVSGAGILLSNSAAQAAEWWKAENDTSNVCKREPGAIAWAKILDGVPYIGICGAFYQKTLLPTVADLTVQNAVSQAGVMVHEFSHNSIHAQDLTYNCNAGFKVKDIFFEGGAAALANALPGRGLFNADSYRCWAEDTYLNWSGSTASAPSRLPGAP